jgi:hypothetical protein
MKYAEIKEKVLDFQTNELVDKNVFILYLHTVRSFLGSGLF